MSLHEAFIAVCCGLPEGQSIRTSSRKLTRLSRRSLCKIAVPTVISTIANAQAARARLFEDWSNALEKFNKNGFARAMEYGMTSYEELIAEKKRKLFRCIDEDSTVADIGIGTGPNIQYMPKNVRLVGIEPNKFMWRYAEEKAQRLGIELTLKEGVCENLPLKDESCDFVITTLTLCSVRSPTAAVEEIFRVLKRGGRHVFIEHVIGSLERPVLRGAQTVLNPIQVALADGCHLNRDTLSCLKGVNNGAYDRIEYEEFDALLGGVEDWISPIKPHIAGFVVK
ncbi:Methyltransferase [Gracilaria domingensis]|nr:Methyltransferase [Gracilaria domingensis]